MDYSRKDDFYYALNKDYNENATDSFLFRYFKKQKDRKAEKAETETEAKKKSKYVYLKSSYSDYCNGKLDSSEMADILKDLSEELTLEDLRPFLGRGEEALSKQKLKVLIKDRIASEFAGKKLDPKGLSLKLIDALYARYIDEEVRNFLYNIGYGKGNSAPRRNDDALDMLFEFLGEKENSSPLPKSARVLTAKDRLSDESYLSDCSDLCDLLNDISFDGGSTLFVPVMIDPETGLGLYMVGGDIIEPAGKDDRNCYFCIIRFDYDPRDPNFGEYALDRSDYGEKEMVRRFKLSYCIENKGRKYTDLKTAKNAYLSLLRQEDTVYEGYVSVNENLSEEISDSDVETFLKYFVAKEDMSEVLESRKRALGMYRAARSRNARMGSEKKM